MSRKDIALGLLPEIEVGRPIRNDVAGKPVRPSCNLQLEPHKLVAEDRRTNGRWFNESHGNQGIRRMLRKIEITSNRSVRAKAASRTT